VQALVTGGRLAAAVRAPGCTEPARGTDDCFEWEEAASEQRLVSCEAPSSNSKVEVASPATPPDYLGPRYGFTQMNHLGPRYEMPKFRQTSQKCSGIIWETGVYGQNGATV